MYPFELFRSIPLIVLASTWCSFWAPADLHGEETIRFSQHIRPLLVRKCFACHGPDEEAREGGLGLHDRQLALAELDSGELGIVPGDPSSSEVLRRILSDDDHERMPPSESSPPLTTEEKQLIEQWIKEGAPYDLHWSFASLTRPAPPNSPTSQWPINPIDQFVLSKLIEHQLEPAEPATRETLIRRLSLDLRGVPPSVAEIDLFVADEADGAYERLVDRFLASNKFGEHWARQWLDLARYADSQGYAQDEIRTIWPYRDWVIEAFNQDMPFDQFTMEQLAGDLFEDPTTSQLIATGFHRNTMTNTEGGTDDEEFRHAAIVDRVNTTGQVWLGLTLGCAQCHTHKFDPITHREYYQFFDYFNQTADNDQPDNRPTIPYLTKQQTIELAQLNEQMQTLSEFDSNDPDQLSAAVKRLDEIKKRIGSLKSYRTPVMQQLPKENFRSTHIALRGAFKDLGAPVSVGLPDAFQSSYGVVPKDRLELAKWLVAPENPLTARVAVNRIWQQIFGRGLVETSEDFGSQGAFPSHPQLLDWLATEFIQNGWSRKKLIRTIVLSATYRQSSASSERKNRTDFDNRLLSRGARYRLSAEQIRDYALAVSGLLSDKMYGPPVRPPQPKSGIKAAFGGSLDWEPSPGEDRYRRGIYTLWRRTSPYPSFMALDAVDRRVCTARRIETNTPVAAFVTLNDPAFVEAAVATSLRLLGTVDDTQRVEAAYRLIVGRSPSSEEHKIVDQLLQQQMEIYAADAHAAKQLVATHQPASKLDGGRVIEAAAWTVVVNSLLNLDEVLTRN